MNNIQFELDLHAIQQKYVFQISLPTIYGVKNVNTKFKQFVVIWFLPQSRK